jgi:pimeloyl-ACP methyl ester carboxylesterase
VLVAPAPHRANALQALAFLTAHLPNDDIQEQIIADNLAGSRQAKLAWPTSSIHEDISKEVSKIAVPTLILAGDQDRQDSLEQHEREVLARIPGARMTVLRNCGHLLPIDQPDELADAIRNFVSGLDRTSAAHS